MRIFVFPGLAHVRYWDDAAILAAFRRTGSMSAVVETMGCHFYTVRDTLARAGIAHPLARGA